MNKVICLHGWTYEIGKWQPLINLLSKNGLNCEMLKIPGLTAPDPDIPWKLNDYVEWLDQTLDRNIKSNKLNESSTASDNNNAKKNKHQGIILLGHSNGGRIATAYTAKNSDKIVKLILIDSAGVIDQRWLFKLKRLIFWFLAKAGGLLTKNQTAKSLLYKLAREKDYHESSEVMKQTMRNLISKDLRMYMQLIKCPTLILWGGKDKITPLINARITNQNIPNSQLKIIPSAGHAPMFSHTKEVAKLIVEFCNT